MRKQQVVYQDGDTQKLSHNEVILSLIDEEKVPRKHVDECKKHAKDGLYKFRKPLPTIS